MAEDICDLEVYREEQKEKNIPFQCDVFTDHEGKNIVKFASFTTWISSILCECGKTKTSTLSTILSQSWLVASGVE